jgi:excisionase family DNA binding protein
LIILLYVIGFLSSAIPMTCSRVLWYKAPAMTLTTQEAADRLGISRVRVHQLIREQRLPADKKGRDYFIEEKALRLVCDRKPGRPRAKAKKRQP